MIADGYTGRKGKGGFYRLLRDGGAKTKQVVDLTTGTYRAVRKPALASLDAAKQGGPGALLMAQDRGGAYARDVLGRTLAYAIGLVPEVAEDIEAADRAMRLGYNWKYGPFELVDRIGPLNLISLLQGLGIVVPPLLQTAAAGGGFYRDADSRREALQPDGSYRPVTRPDGVLALDDIKRHGARVDGNGSASLWDLGDGVLCLEVHTKLNVLDGDVMALIGRTIARVPQHHVALVIYTDASNFSAGANLGLGLFAANLAMWDELERQIALGQQTYRALRHAPFPVVAATAGLALGGGCELAMAADAVQAHAETYMGLVEAGAGIVPA